MYRTSLFIFKIICLQIPLSTFSLVQADIIFPSQLLNTTFEENVIYYKTSLNEFCTGTVIQDQKILTAAHCVFKIKSWMKPKFKFLTNGSNNNLIGEIKKVSIPKEFFSKLGSNENHTAYDHDAKISYNKMYDVAIIHLTDKIKLIKKETDVELINTIKSVEDAPIAYEKPVNFYGYGENKYDLTFGDPSKQYKYLENLGEFNRGENFLINPSKTDSIITRDKIEMLQIESYIEFSVKNGSLTSICLSPPCSIFQRGDSGGPLLEKILDKNYLSGIVSYDSKHFRNIRYTFSVENYSHNEFFNLGFYERSKYIKGKFHIGDDQKWFDPTHNLYRFNQYVKNKIDFTLNHQSIPMKNLSIERKADLEITEFFTNLRHPVIHRFIKKELGL
ncbi:S1 family peptidase [Bacteriovoracaceae bacterium]|nr:S1 family peptidase [Bacteriovoracaceae bacterium]